MDSIRAHDNCYITDHLMIALHLHCTVVIIVKVSFIICSIAIA